MYLHIWNNLVDEEMLLNDDFNVNIVLEDEQCFIDFLLAQYFI